jgi:hypothetical protein
VAAAVDLVLPKRADFEDVLIIEAVSSSSWAVVEKSVVAWDTGLDVTDVGVCVLESGLGRGGRSGLGLGPSSWAWLVAGSLASVTVMLACDGGVGSTSATSSISTSSASRYHFLRLVQRPQPSWPRRPFCHCAC